MKYLLIILSVFGLTACLDKEDNDRYITGTWHLKCSYKDNVLSDIQGEYRFDKGTFYATIKSCGTVEGTEYMVTVDFPYSFGDTVTLGNGLEAVELKLYTSGGEILALVHREEDRDRVYWNWGLNNTSIRHSIFGFYVVDDTPEWGGYPLRRDNEDPDKYYPVKTNFPEQDYPTTVSFDEYIDDGKLPED